MRPSAAAAAAWNVAFLETPHQHAGAMRTWMQDHHLAAVPTFGAPLFLDQIDRAVLAAASETVGTALSKLGAALAAGAGPVHCCPMDAGRRALFESDASHTDPTCVWRLDGVYDADARTVTFFECNGGDPSGMGWVDRLATLFMQLPAMAAVRRLMSVDTTPLQTSLHALFHRRLGRSPGHVVFMCGQESFVRSDHQCLAEDAQAAGLAASAADPRDLQWRGGRVWHGDVQVDGIYRDTIDEFLLPPHAEAAARIAEAYKRRAVWMLNPLAATYADYKALFSQLPSTPHVAATQILTPQRVEHVREQQQTLVLKPNDGYGGFGVYVGADLSANAWNAALNELLALPAGGVVQHHHPLPLLSLPVLGPDGFAGMERRRVTISTWLHDGKFAGAFARAGPGAVVNVHQGGGIVPVFWVEALRR